MCVLQSKFSNRGARAGVAGAGSAFADIALDLGGVVLKINTTSIILPRGWRYFYHLGETLQELCESTKLIHFVYLPLKQVKFCGTL